MSKISEHISEYLKKHSGNEEKIEHFAEFVESFFDDLDESEQEIKHAFKNDVEDFVLEIDKDVLKKVIETFKHKDGSDSGLKWSCEETTAVAKQYDAEVKIETFGKEYCELYFWFLMNYVYAVHYSPSRVIATYVEIAIDEYCNKIICFKEMIKHLVKHHAE